MGALRTEQLSTVDEDGSLCPALPFVSAFLHVDLAALIEDSTGFIARWKDQLLGVTVDVQKLCGHNLQILNYVGYIRDILGLYRG